MINHEEQQKPSQAGSRPPQAETHDANSGQAIQPAEGARSSQQAVESLDLPVVSTELERHQLGAPASASIYDRIDSPIDAIQQLGTMIARSGMFGCQKMEQGSMLALHCFTEKKSPLELARKYHLIAGKLTVRSDWMLGEFNRLGGKVEWLTFTNEEAEANFIYRGITTKVKFTMADAARGGVANGNAWAKWPDAMLRARLISKALRMVCPEAVAGTYTADEISETSPAQEQQLFS